MRAGGEWGAGAAPPPRARALAPSRPSRRAPRGQWRGSLGRPNLSAPARPHRWPALRCGPALLRSARGKENAHRPCGLVWSPRGCPGRRCAEWPGAPGGRGACASPAARARPRGRWRLGLAFAPLALSLSAPHLSPTLDGCGRRRAPAPLSTEGQAECQAWPTGWGSGGHSRGRSCPQAPSAGRWAFGFCFLSGGRSPLCPLVLLGRQVPCAHSGEHLFIPLPLVACLPLPSSARPGVQSEGVCSGLMSRGVGRLLTSLRPSQGSATPSSWLL